MLLYVELILDPKSLESGCLPYWLRDEGSGFFFSNLRSNSISTLLFVIANVCGLIVQLLGLQR